MLSVILKDKMKSLWYKPCTKSQYPLDNQEKQFIRFIFVDHKQQPSNNSATNLV